MVKKKYSRSEVIAGIACVLLAVAILTFYVWHQTQLISLGYETRNLEERLNSLKEDIKRLEVEKMALLAPERVEKIAREALRLEEPGAGQVIYHDFSKALLRNNRDE